MNDKSATPNFPIGGEQERFAQAAVNSQRAWRAVCLPPGSNCQGAILSAQQLHTQHTPTRGREQQPGNGQRPPGSSPGGATACGGGGGTCESPWPRVARGGRAGARPQQPLPHMRRGHWGCAQDRPQPPGPETPSADSPTARSSTHTGHGRSGAAVRRDRVPGKRGSGGVTLADYTQPKVSVRPSAPPSTRMQGVRGERGRGMTGRGKSRDRACRGGAPPTPSQCLGVPRNISSVVRVALPIPNACCHSSRGASRELRMGPRPRGWAGGISQHPPPVLRSHGDSSCPWLCRSPSLSLGDPHPRAAVTACLPSCTLMSIRAPRGSLDTAQGRWAEGRRLGSGVEQCRAGFSTHPRGSSGAGLRALRGRTGGSSPGSR